MSDTPLCVLGKKDHHFVLVASPSGNLTRTCIGCKLDPQQVAGMNQATAIALTIEAVILLLDQDPNDADQGVYLTMKQRLFNAAKAAGLIERSKEADDDDGS